MFDVFQQSYETHHPHSLHRQFLPQPHRGRLFARGGGDLVNVQSAGSNPAGHVHPLAIKVMAEAGIDISGHRSKHLKEFLDQPVHTVITVCGNADQACPIFPGQVNRHHWPF
jgi:arsenate reductase